MRQSFTDINGSTMEVLRQIDTVRQLRPGTLIGIVAFADGKEQESRYFDVGIKVVRKQMDTPKLIGTIKGILKEIEMLKSGKGDLVKGKAGLSGIRKGSLEDMGYSLIEKDR